MKKLLKPGDVLLLGLAGAMDVFEDVKDPLGIMSSGCKNLYGWVPERYQRHNFSRVVARQLVTGDIEKVIKGDQVYLRLTSIGKDKIMRDFPMFSMAAKSWDRRWRIVMFDIAEIDKKTRDALRYKLRELGFGMLQESVWITPHDMSMDIREFLENYDLGDVAFVLEVSEILAGNIRALVTKIWHLDELEQEYHNIINEAAQLQNMYVTVRGRGGQRTEVRESLGKGKEKKLGKSGEVGENELEKGVVDKHEAEKKVREVRQRYVAVVLADPCLPKELLPDDWPAARAKTAVEGLGKV